MIPNFEEKFYSVGEAAEQAGMSYDGIRTAIHTGRLRAYKVVGRVKIKASDLEEFLRPVPIVPETETEGVQ